MSAEVTLQGFTAPEVTYTEGSNELSGFVEVIVDGNLLYRELCVTFKRFTYDQFENSTGIDLDTVYPERPEPAGM